MWAQASNGAWAGKAQRAQRRRRRRRGAQSSLSGRDGRPWHVIIVYMNKKKIRSSVQKTVLKNKLQYNLTKSLLIHHIYRKSCWFIKCTCPSIEPLHKNIGEDMPRAAGSPTKICSCATIHLHNYKHYKSFTNTRWAKEPRNCYSK